MESPIGNCWIFFLELSNWAMIVRVGSEFELLLPQVFFFYQEQSLAFESNS